MTAARARLEELTTRRLVLMVLLSYGALRLVSGAFMLVVAAHQGPDGITGGPDNGASAGYWDITRAWDGTWYGEIAEHGYPHHIPRDHTATVEQNAWAFYPLYPMLVRLLMALTGASFDVAGSLLSLALGALACVLMALLFRPRIGAYAAWLAVTVFAAAPPSPVLQMTYSESTALVLVLAFLLMLEREQWLWAAFVALATGIARPVAVPLALVALATCAWRWWQRRERPIGRRELVGMISLLAACGVSGVIWPTVAWAVTGERDAYTATMASWRSTPEVVPFQPWHDNFTYLFGDRWWLWLVGLVGLYFVLVLGPWSWGLGVPMVSWCAAYGLYLLAVLDVWTSTYRYLLFAFPLAAVLVGAGWRERERRILPGLRTIVWVVIFIGWQWWWCAELLLITPPDNPV